MGEDGKLHWVDKAGADSALNFSSEIDVDTFNIFGSQGTTYTQTIPIAKHKKVYVITMGQGVYVASGTWKIVTEDGKTKLLFLLKLFLVTQGDNCNTRPNFFI